MYSKEEQAKDKAYQAGLGCLGIGLSAFMLFCWVCYVINMWNETAGH